MRGILVVGVMLVATLGCHSSMDRVDAGLTESDPVEADPSETDSPEDPCTPLIGYLMDMERWCIDYSTDIFMGCRYPESITLLVGACFRNDTTGMYVYRWDVPLELESQGWTWVSSEVSDCPSEACE